MNQVLLIARYQFLMARRTMNWWYYFSVAGLLLFFGMLCSVIPFNYLILTLPLMAFFMQNTISRMLLHRPYELDAGYLSIYPLSQQRKFNLLLLIDLFHISGLIYLLCFLILIISSIIRFGITECLFLIATITVYWFFFSAVFLCLRTLCRRNYTYFYVIRVSGSVIVFAYFISVNLFKNYKTLPVVINSISHLSFLLYSVIAQLILAFIISRLFTNYLRKHPFADPQLADKFVNPRWK